jgi:hypothetical protein
MRGPERAFRSGLANGTAGIEVCGELGSRTGIWRPLRTVPGVGDREFAAMRALQGLLSLLSQMRTATFNNPRGEAPLLARPSIAVLISLLKVPNAASS